MIHKEVLESRDKVGRVEQSSCDMSDGVEACEDCLGEKDQSLPAWANCAQDDCSKQIRRSLSPNSLKFTLRKILPVFWILWGLRVTKDFQDFYGRVSWEASRAQFELLTICVYDRTLHYMGLSYMNKKKKKNW